ncbi:multicopper oxidase family protein [Gloeothece verrucosa]|uniref:Multicopper oxidase CueO n=1 Tax=Gloeothece verrucosa (strain PCC 7822) TaxID=497965 RepID=E0UKZ0_GLOV7|nr:multicopper oxidase domain-containing protein [Gloeothece verrucosa]ADN17620.1 Bilirubin oxidase [Gloeothece verrucosa PCC 7822]
MNISRRDAFKWGLGASGMLMLPWTFPEKALAQTAPPDDNDTTTTFTPFQVALPISPVLSPVQRTSTTDYYYIVLQKTQMPIQGLAATGVPTNVWSYTGITNRGLLPAVIPGPTIRQQIGRQSVVRFVNCLGNLAENDIPTTDKQKWPIGEPINAVIHLHGMASLPQYDGYTVDYIQPYYYKDYHYPNDRPATFWYHDHALDRTRRNVAMGMAGIYVVYDQFELDNLPSGNYDIPLVFQSYPDPAGATAYNGYTLVNGVYQARLQVKPRKYRFRLLNATATQTLYLSLLQTDATSRAYPGPVITVIGTDGGLVEKPVTTTELRIGMGERYEILIDFSQYYLADATNNFVFLITNNQDASNGDGGSTTPLLLFEITTPDNEDQLVIPNTLRPFKALPTSGVRRVRQFVFDFTPKADVPPVSDPNASTEQCIPNQTQIATINGKRWDTQRVDADPGLGDIEIWSLVNKTALIHPIHIHLLDFQMLSRNGQPPLPYEQNWKDIFLLGPYDEIEIIGQLGPNRGKYMMHCHNLLHEDCAMMTQFEVGQGGPDPCSAPAQPLTPEDCRNLGIEDLCPKSVHTEILEGS